MTDLTTPMQNGYFIDAEDRAGNLGGTVEFRLFYGFDSFEHPTKVRIMNTGGVGGLFDINIRRIKNPATDNLWSFVNIRTGDGANGLKDFHSFRYAVYTNSKAAASIGSAGVPALTNLNALSATSTTGAHMTFNSGIGT